MSKSPIKAAGSAAANAAASAADAVTDAAESLLCKLDARKTKYCPQNAVWLSKAAGLTYKDAATVKAEMRKWGYEKFHFFDTNETQGFIAAGDHTIVIAFRGTTCLQDWMTNERIMLMPKFGGMVHRGFLAALNHVWGEIDRKITEFRDNNQSILVTGHSLGGALATLATATLREKNLPVTGLYTFGSPRVGDRKFADKFDAGFKSQTFRFVNNNDVVTRVVPRSFLYSHVGTCLYFDVSGTMQSNIQFWDKFLETVKGSLEEFSKPGVECIDDHKMSTYEKNVLKNVEKLLS